MKKFLFLITAIAVSTTVFSQVRFGIKGGLNMANQKIKVSLMGQSYDQTGDGIVSFHVGGVAEIPIARNFAFRPELLLSGKGMNLDAEDPDTEEPFTAKIRPFYLEVPLNVVYTHEFPAGLRFYGGAGPSIAYGLFGKVKGNGQEDDAFQDEGFKRFDFGINILAGIELNSGLTFGVNFTPGLANITEAEDTSGFGADVKWTNSVFGVSVGYMFGRKQQ
jgi:hypothetical protein